MSWNRSGRTGPVPLGLVETTAAGIYALYGHFPEGYTEWAKRYGGGIPRRVFELAERLRAERPWEIVANPHPGMTRIHCGPHSFLVPTAEILGPAERYPSNGESDA